MLHQSDPAGFACARETADPGPGLVALPELPLRPAAARVQPSARRAPPEGRDGAACGSVLGAIGRTPLVSLRRVIPVLSGRLYAKLEGSNPGGSAKDRAALSMLDHAIEGGLVTRDTTIIESSSGNMALGLALACAYHRLRFVCVVDAKATAQNVALLRVYGAELHVVTEPDPATGEFLPARLARVRELLDAIPNSFWTDQCANRHNALAHYQTMREIDEALDGRVDYLFCATGTCGTARGCIDYCTEHGLRTRIVAVDALGSRIFAGTAGPRLIPGYGAAICPELGREIPVDHVVHVSDPEAVDGCRRLLREEGILAGGSSGGVITAVERLLPRIPPDAVAVAIFPDRGERYLDTIFDDEWVRRHLGGRAPSPHIRAPANGRTS